MAKKPAEKLAKKLKEFKVRDAAHAYQARVIADGSHPLACCTEHPEKGDVVVVWSEQPTLEEIKAFSPDKDWDPTPGGVGQRRRNPVRS